MDLAQLKLCHSFLLFQTNNQQIAKALPYVVYSHQTELLDSSVNSNDVTYNWTVDCSFYLICGKPCVITSQIPLQAVLNLEQRKILLDHGYFKLHHTKNYKLYVYIPHDDQNHSRFSEVSVELFIHPKGYIVFSGNKNYGNYSQIFKQQKLDQKQGQWYCITSQYALLSDIHFLNSIKSGKSNSGSYLKIDEKWHSYLNREIIQWISSRIISSKL